MNRAGTEYFTIRTVISEDLSTRGIVAFTGPAERPSPLPLKSR
jgi:hypothetical protein